MTDIETTRRLFAAGVRPSAEEALAMLDQIERLLEAIEPFAVIGLNVLQYHPGWANPAFTAQWCGYPITYAQFEAAAAVALAGRILEQQAETP